jgi:hypothetical protein
MPLPQRKAPCGGQESKPEPSAHKATSQAVLRHAQGKQFYAMPICQESSILRWVCVLQAVVAAALVQQQHHLLMHGPDFGSRYCMRIRQYNLQSFWKAAAAATAADTAAGVDGAAAAAATAGGGML